MLKSRKMLATAILALCLNSALAAPPGAIAPAVSTSAVIGSAFSPAVPNTLAANGSWTSTIQGPSLYPGLSISVTSSQAGVLSVQRYLDVAGNIPQGSPVQTNLTGGTTATLNVGDNAPFLFWRVTITNTTGAVANLSNFGYALSPVGGIGGYTDAQGNVSAGFVPLLYGLPAGTAANPYNVQQTTPVSTVGPDPTGQPTTGSPVLFGVYSGGNTYRVQGDTAGRVATYPSATDNSLGALQPTVSFGVIGLVGKGSPGNMYRAKIKNLTTNVGCVYGLNRTSIPSSGPLTVGEVVDASELAASGEAFFNNANLFGDRYSAGIVIVVSSGACSTTPTYTTSPAVSSLIRIFQR